MIASFFKELYRRNPVLALFGWVLAGLFLLTFAGSFFDSRTILGINPWIKPMKFMVSIAIYAWTLSWLLEYVRMATFARKLIIGGTLIAMTTEIVLIVMQSARGTPSHFNNATVFDGVVFGIMGLMILFSTVLDVILLGLFFRKGIVLPRSYLWGIRIGIFIFLMGSVVGGMLVRHMAHTVGAADGGPGLPFLNWSTVAGDLRVSHALGLHALQVIPFIGFALTRTELSPKRQTVTIMVVGTIYAGVVVLLFLEAMHGVPLIAL